MQRKKSNIGIVIAVIFGIILTAAMLLIGVPFVIGFLKGPEERTTYGPMGHYESTGVRTTRLTDEQLKMAEEAAENSLFYDVSGEEDEYRAMLASEPSDIEGMTKLDKLDMGLSPDDGSDSDRDGLTDKEEIEVYGTDPKKKSTAGDLYTDGYKVSNGMDPLESYEYDGVLEAEGNECPEVELNISTVDDFYAVVKDVTGRADYFYLNSVSAEWLKDYNILKEYTIYNYDGRLSIDVSDTGFPAEKVDAMLVFSDYSDGMQGTLNQDFSFKAGGDKLEFDSHEYISGVTLMLYERTDLTESLKDEMHLNSTSDRGDRRSFIDTVRDGAASLPFLSWFVDSDGDGNDDAAGSILITYDLKSNMSKDLKKPGIIYVPTGDTAKDAETIDTALKAARYLSDEHLKNGNLTSSDCKAVTAAEYKVRLWVQTLLPGKINHLGMFDPTWTLTREGALDLIALKEEHIIPGTRTEYENGVYMIRDPETGARTYYLPDGSTLYKAWDDPDGFSFTRDRFAFRNFCSEYSLGGNCAGLVQFMNIAYNTGSFPTSGSYAGISWDLMDPSDTDNDSLIESGNLYNFKGADFTDSHYIGAKVRIPGDKPNTYTEEDIISGLTGGENEFVKMIGAYWAESNSHAAELKRPGVTDYNYGLIEEMKDLLDQNKILGCGLAVYSLWAGKPVLDGGHAITIYGYENVDNATTRFLVYDTNISDEGFYQNATYRAYDEDRQEYQFAPTNMYITVTRKASELGDYDSFEFLYSPLPTVDKMYISTNQSWWTTEKDPDGIDIYKFRIWDESGENISDRY